MSDQTPWRWAYRRLGTKSVEDNMDEVDEGYIQHQKFFSGPRNVFILIALSTCGATALLAFGFGVLLTAGHATDQSSVKMCGNSTAEAIASGCEFDQLMWAWYPKECPHYMNDQFVKAEPEPWVFYVDPYKKVIANKEDWGKMLDNEIQLFGERREHLTHCVFMYLSVGQILRDGTRFTQLQVDYEHMEHCSKILLDALRKDDKWFDIETGTPLVRYDQMC